MQGCAQAALLLPGCFISRETTNEPLKRESIDALEIGKSSATDAAKALGAPAEVVQLGSRSAWAYDFRVTKLAGFSIIILTFVNEDQRSDRCWLFFDKDEILRHAATTLDAADSRYAMPWQDDN